MTTTVHAVVSLGQLYRDRADAENAFDELKSQWGWAEVTTHDMHRCELSAQAVALTHNWWSLFVRPAHPQARREALTSRPWLMAAVGRATSHARPTTLTLCGLPAHAEEAKAAPMQVSTRLRAWATQTGEQFTTQAVWRFVCDRLKQTLAAVGSPNTCLKMGLRHRVTGVFRINREVIGWSLKPRMTPDRVGAALTMAWFRRRPEPGVLHHSDQGSQHSGRAFQDKLKECGTTCSMSLKGTFWDNAATQSWLNSFKNERVHGLRYATNADMRAASFEYIEVFYNRMRQYLTIAYRSPVQYLDRWTSTQSQERLAA